MQNPNKVKLITNYPKFLVKESIENANSNIQKNTQVNKYINKSKQKVPNQ